MMRIADLFETNLPLSGKQIPRVRGSYGAFVITMSPRDFLALTTVDQNELDQIVNRPFPYDKEEYVNRLGRDDGFGKYDIPFLKVEFPSGKIIGHEGRHRANMVMQSGGNNLPVVVYPYEEYSFDVRLEYYDDDDKLVTELLGPFGSHEEAVHALENARSSLEERDFFVSRKTRIHSHPGGILKGQPDRSDGWERAAWKKEDFPKQLVGQYRHVVINRFKIGLVKGYRHHTR